MPGYRTLIVSPEALWKDTIPKRNPSAGRSEGRIWAPGAGKTYLPPWGALEGSKGALRGGDKK